MAPIEIFAFVLRYSFAVVACAEAALIIRALVSMVVEKSNVVPVAAPAEE